MWSKQKCERFEAGREKLKPEPKALRGGFEAKTRSKKEKELASPCRKASVSLTIALKSLLWEKESQNS